MNILFVTPFYAPQAGGVATYVEGLKAYLSSAGHRAYVLRAGDSHAIRPCGRCGQKDVFELYLRDPWVPQARLRGLVAFLVFFVPTLWRLARFLRERGIGRVSLEYPQPYMFYFFLLRRWTGIKIAAGLHGDDIRLLYRQPAHGRWLVNRMVHMADCVLTHSANLLHDAEELIGPLPERKLNLPCWVDVAAFRGRAGGGTVRRDRTKYALTVAKLDKRKGVDVLLHAIAALRECGMRFVVAGDGPEEISLRRLVSQLGIEDRVELMGRVNYEDIPALVRDCEFFVLPSRIEAFGIALLEAMAFEKAVLATRVGGIPEFVTDGFNGLLVPAEDSQALAAKLALLTADGGLRERLGKNGWATVKRHYDLAVLGPSYERLYTSIISGSR